MRQTGRRPVSFEDTIDHRPSAFGMTLLFQQGMFTAGNKGHQEAAHREGVRTIEDLRKFLEDQTGREVQEKPGGEWDEDQWSRLGCTQDEINMDWVSELHLLLDRFDTVPHNSTDSSPLLHLKLVASRVPHVRLHLH